MTDATTDTTPEFDYQTTEPTAPAIEQGRETIRNLQSPSEAIAVAKERIAFESYVKDQGGRIPSNFKDAGSWFDSLKNAQKEYTQTKQDMAELKTQYAQNPDNPNYVPPSAMSNTAPPANEPQAMDAMVEELRIPEKKVEIVSTDKPSNGPTVTEEDWKGWTVEFATKGTLSDETQASIRAKTQLPDYVINEYMAGQKAKIEVAYQKASLVIGGKDKLNKLFTWASQNLSQSEQDNMNSSLASSNWEIALLGLNAKYDKVNGSRAGTEPTTTTTQQKIPVASTQTALIPYRTKREFSADRNNPRFNVDPRYRTAVEQRMQQTDFNKLMP